MRSRPDDTACTGRIRPEPARAERPHHVPRLPRPRAAPARSVACLLAVHLLLPAAAGAAEPGTAGFLSLRFGTGARYAGMGDAGVSLARDATAAYWNPAGLASVRTTGFALQHNEWLETVRVESASIAHATEIGVFGLHFSGMYTDEIERTTSASSTPEGHFNVYEIAVQGVYGHSLGRSEKLGDVDVGFGFKGLFGGLDEETARGWAVDLGAHLRSRIEGLTFGIAGLHLGPEMRFIEDSFELPVTLRVGADYEKNLPQYKSGFVLAYDLEVVNDDEDLRNHFGVEYTYLERLSLRGGVKTGFDTQGGSFGVGVRHRGYRFDYAFTGVSDDLGNVHRFSIAADL
jgi:hypothetical protein